MKTASPIHLVVAVIVTLALLAMAGSVRAQSRVLFGSFGSEGSGPDCMHPNDPSVMTGRC